MPQASLMTLVIVSLLACSSETVAPFVVVEIPADQITRSKHLPSSKMYDLVPEDYCSDDRMVSIETARENGYKFVVPAWDFVYYDGMTWEETVTYLMQVTEADGVFQIMDESLCYYGPKGDDPPVLGKSLMCADGVDPTRFVSTEDLSILCSEEWQKCFGPFSVIGGVYATDPLYYTHGEVLSPEEASICECPPLTTAQDGTVVVSDELYRLAEEWFYKWDVFKWETAVEGDASISIENVAKEWKPVPERASPENNAGLCGMWIFSDEEYAELSAPSKDPSQPRMIEQICGAVSVPSVCDGLECTEETLGGYVQPLTALRVILPPIKGFLSQTSTVQVGGTGDMLNAYTLANVDSSDRLCPTCDRQSAECKTLSGAATVRYSSYLRQRAKLDGETIHVVVAECAPTDIQVGFNWQRACWHAQLPASDLEDDNELPHIRIGVGAIGDAVSRPLEPYQEFKENERAD